MILPSCRFGSPTIAVILAILDLRRTMQTSLGMVGAGSATSHVNMNNGVRGDLRMFSCCEYVTLHMVLPPRQTPATYGRLLDVNTVSLLPGLDFGCRDARMSMQLAP